MPDTVEQKMERLTPLQRGLLHQVSQAGIAFDNAKVAYARTVQRAVNEPGVVKISYEMLSRETGLRKETIWRRLQSYLSGKHDSR